MRHTQGTLPLRDLALVPHRTSVAVRAMSSAVPLAGPGAAIAIAPNALKATPTPIMPVDWVLFLLIVPFLQMVGDWPTQHSGTVRQTQRAIGQVSGAVFASRTVAATSSAPEADAEEVKP